MLRLKVFQADGSLIPLRETAYQVIWYAVFASTVRAQNLLVIQREGGVGVSTV